MRSRSGLGIAAAALVLASGPAGALAQDRAGATPERDYHLFLTGKSKVVVATALEGAAARLSTATCRLVLDDFTDANGRTLSTDLAATGMSLDTYLASLYYVESDGTAQCRGPNLMAFTTPGSRVVHVCGERFAKWRIDPVVGETLLIHELLHALGLGENPPSSESITAAVRRRCEVRPLVQPGPAVDVQFRAPIPSSPIRPR